MHVAPLPSGTATTVAAVTKEKGIIVACTLTCWHIVKASNQAGPYPFEAKVDANTACPILVLFAGLPCGQELEKAAWRAAHLHACCAGILSTSYSHGR
jgi:hypothetical protein